jgi:DNA/RNA endonuclease G (NUC1)
MFRANKDVRDELLRVMREEYPAHLAAVAAAFGAKVEAPEVGRVVKNGTTRCIVTPPTMSGITDSREIIAGPMDFWVIVTVSDADAEQRDLKLEAHTAAMVTALEGERVEVTDFDTSPPGVEDNEQVQSVGVRVRVEVAVSR